MFCTHSEPLSLYDSAGKRSQLTRCLTSATPAQVAPPAAPAPPPKPDYSYAPPLNQVTDLSNWRLRVSNGSHGRHEWVYLRTAAEREAWPQTTEDKYWLGLQTVRFRSLIEREELRLIVFEAS